MLCVPVREEVRIVVRRIVAAADGTGVALLVAALGVLLILQGWRSRIPDFGVLTTIDAAQELVDHHRLPERGAVSSFESFTPPGLAWLMIPGLLVARDPRLFEYVGSVSLYVGTLVGVFLVARRVFGRNAALLAVVVYGWSEFGLTAGSSLFQRYPLQFFIVAIVYCVLRWVDDNDSRWIAAAALTWAAGMNVHMELAPAVLVAPVLWLLWRPAVRLLPLALAAAAAAALWYPYVAFERDRRFIDLRSQILREPIRRVDFADSWCDPGRVPGQWLVDAARERAWEASRSAWSTRRWLSDRANALVGLWSANFTQSRVPGARYALFLLSVLGVAASLVGAAARTRQSVSRWEGDGGGRLKWLALGVAILAVAFNEYALSHVSADRVLGRSSIWTIRAGQTCLLVIALLLARFRRAIAAGWLQAARLLSPSSPQPAVFGLCLAVMWLALLLVADAERRFWQLWPLQAIALSAAVVYVPRLLGVPRTLRWCAAASVCVVVLSNAVLFAHLESWRREGWAGRDAPEIAVVDAIAGRMHAKRTTDTSVGYQVDFWRFMADVNSVDSRYKVGADIDLLLKYRHRISNQDRCAEGFRPEDDYRVVQIAHRPMVNSHELNRLSPAANVRSTFALLSRAERYDVLERR